MQNGPRIPGAGESLFPEVCLADFIVPLGLKLALSTLGKSQLYPLTWRKFIFIFIIVVIAGFIYYVYYVY